VLGCSACELFGDGGGICNTGTLTVTNSEIKNNLVGYGGDEGYASGGGIANKGGTVNIINSTFSGNTAYVNGGGILNNGSLSITGSTFSNNHGGSGGGVHTFGTLTLKNSTLSGNDATNGGGLMYSGGPASITNCTITGNTGYGGGIYNHVYELGGGSVPAGVFTIRNSIVAGNSNNYNGTEGADYYFPLDSSIPPAGYGNLTSFGYNLFGKVDAPHNWTFTGQATR
jgi:hypothetical protein